MEIKPDKRPYACTMVTKENLDRIIQDIREGSTNKHAAESNFITEKHFYNLINQGLCDIQHGVYDSLHAYLVQSLREIEKDEIKSCRKDIRKSKKGHKGAEWTLEHAYWRSFCGDAKLMELAEDIDRAKGEAKDEKAKQGAKKGS